MKKMIALALIVGMLNSGCAVMMAANQPSKVDEGVLTAGMPRNAILAELGAPITTDTTNGKRTDLISYTQGTGTGWKVGRAVFHGIADVATIFLWELIATPIETIWGKKDKSVQVVYDAKGNVETVQYLKKG
jgi:hypothetical protein